MPGLVMVETYTDIMEAYIARGRLEAEGVPVILYNENHIATNWLIAHAIGGIKVMVADSDLITARRILKAHEAGEYEIEPDITYNDGLHCPKCQGTNITSDKPWLATLLGFLVLGVYALIMAKSRTLHKCGRCNHYWHRWTEESDTRSIEDEPDHDRM